MPDFYTKFNGKIDRRSPRNEGKPEDPVMRENWLSRDGILKRPAGIERCITTTLSGYPKWMGRYNTLEIGQITPKSFCYTDNGKLWVIDDNAQTATEIKDQLKSNGYPKHWLFKRGEQVFLYLVDGENLYKFDGNNDNRFEKVKVEDSGGLPVNPIDIIEHKDRLCLISKAYLFISANLSPDTFDSATDSIQIIVGSGKGENLALGKIGDNLFILNTEGIFVLAGDVISALAATFEVRLVDERKIIAGRSAVKVERAIIFLADDLNLWSFNGSSSEKLSHSEKLEDFINPKRIYLYKAIAHYYYNYYMLSFVETGEIDNKIEVWYDTIEGKIDFVRSRNVGCYMSADPTIEETYLQIGSSNRGYILQVGRGKLFDGNAITTRLATRDITVKKGHNVRFTAFYPEFEPVGDRNIIFNYLLDGRLSDLSGNANFTQNLSGEVKKLGQISIKNQSQFIDRIRPKINYAKGASIAFYIQDLTGNLEPNFIGMGIDYIDKGQKKSKRVGA